MPDVIELLRIIKSASKEAVEAAKPTNVVFGRVESVEPLGIRIDQKMLLDSYDLVLSRSVSNYDIDISINWGSELTGIKKITVTNALKAGEKVILVRQQGGEKYIVLDRVVT